MAWTKYTCGNCRGEFKCELRPNVCPYCQKGPSAGKGGERK